MTRSRPQSGFFLFVLIGQVMDEFLSLRTVLLSYLRPMPKIPITICTLASFALNTFLSKSGTAQTVEDYAVMSGCIASANIPAVTLEWATGPGLPDQIYISRKLPTDEDWQFLQSVSGMTNSFADMTAQPGTVYEYSIQANGSNFTGRGYLLCGREVPAVHDRGAVAVIAEATMAAGLGTELERLRHDLIGDGWLVHMLTVGATDAVSVVKQHISELNVAEPALRAVLLIGHVPVPYSGQLYPDGHLEHEGAWPTDHYYADLNDPWSDDTVNLATAARPENRNVIGDGKFDRSEYYAGEDIDLEIGRVDLSSMPGASQSELELTRRYLDRDHAFRTGQLNIPEKAGIDYYFGVNDGEAFAADGYMTFSPIVGRDSVQLMVYSSVLLNEDRLFTYLCGSGTYTSVVGAGASSFFYQNSVGGVFNLMFGSYFGDWDNSDNLLRAPLAGPGSALVNVWAGRPYWHLHQMGLGETIGRCARRSMNNRWYHANYCGNCIHSGLMGDPTLRAHPMPMVSNLAIVSTGESADLTWMASAGAVLGYHIYRKTEGENGFTLLNNTPVPNTAFSDQNPVVGMTTYMVRAIQLKETASGSYFNLSTGLIDSAMIDVNPGISELNGSLRLISAQSGSVHVDVRCQARAATITVTDAVGRQLMQVPYRGSGRYTIDLSALPMAAYLISILTENSVHSLKVLR